MFRKIVPIVMLGVVLMLNAEVAYSGPKKCEGDSKDIDAFIAECESVIRNSPRSGYAFANIGWAYRQKNDDDKALEYFNRALAVDPRDAYSLTHKAAIYINKGDLAEAESLIDTAISLDQKSYYSRRIRAVILEKRGEFSAALTDINKALVGEGDVPHAFILRAKIYEGLKRYDEALQDYNKVERSGAELDNETRRYIQKQKTRISMLRSLADFKIDLSEKVPAPLPPKKLTDGSTRVALVIGNSKYQHAPELANAARDTTAVSAKLRYLGFTKVIEKHDLSYNDLTSALKEFGDAAAEADWAVVYYGGHGIEVGGINYLIPVDAQLRDVGHVEDEALPVSRILSKVESARKMRLVLLDACRDNPFIPKMRVAQGGATRSLGRGLTKIDAPSGVLVAYAAKEGQVAADGGGEHSPFAEALLSQLDQPGLEIGLLLRRVRDRVVQQTGSKQEPFTYGSLPSEQLFIHPPDQ